MKSSLLLCHIFLLVLCTTVHADTYLPIGSKYYDDLRLLEAEGVVTTSQLTTLPISRREAARLTTEAGRDNQDRTPRVRGALDRLRREFKRELDGDSSALLTLDSVDLEYSYSDGESFFAQKNRDGVEVRSGSNAVANVSGRFDSGFVGMAVKPEVDLHEGASQFTLKKAYLLANLGREEFMFGKENAWWGPWQNGATLLSTNAEPLTTLKVSNSTPYFPFGVGVRGTFFITRLNEDRLDVRRPILNGIRLDIKPWSWLELAVSKTAIYGGEGRKEDVESFLQSVFVVDENQASMYEPGDQRAGFDAKVVLPWKIQPVTLSVEMTGEDQRNFFPAKWFRIYGVYLPRVMDLDRLELWAEYAENDDSYYQGAWYTHHIYTQGYTYEDRIIGHYIGADAKNLFLQARYHFDHVDLTLSYERLRKLYPQRFNWEWYRAAAVAEVLPDTDLGLSVGYAREDDDVLLLQVGLSHSFR